MHTNKKKLTSSGKGTCDETFAVVRAWTEKRFRWSVNTGGRATSCMNLRAGWRGGRFASFLSSLVSLKHRNMIYDQKGIPLPSSCL